MIEIMEYRFIIVFAFIASGIDSRSLRKSNYDEEALRVHWNPRTNLLRLNEITEMSDSTELPNDSDDLTAKETNDGVFANLSNNYRTDQSSPFILSHDKNLENLLTDFAINHGDEKNAMQKRMRITMNQLSDDNDFEFKFPKNLDELSDVDESSAPSSQIWKTANGFKDFVDSAGGLEIYYEDDQNDDGHVKFRNADSSALFPLVGSEVFDLNQIDSSISEATKNAKNSTTELDVMLLELEGQVNKMRKYLDSDCRKHRKSTAVNGPVNQPKKKINAPMIERILQLFTNA